MKLFLLLFFSSIPLINIQLSPKNSRFIKKNIHSAWDIQLRKFVSNEGKVNYKDWKNEMAGLEKFKLKKFDKLNHPAKPRWPLDDKAIFLKLV